MQKEYLTDINGYTLETCHCNCEIIQRLLISFSVLTIYHKFQCKRSAAAKNYGKARMIPGLIFYIVYKLKHPLEIIVKL